MFPKLISFDSFYLPTYGLFVAGGFLLGLWVAQKLAARRALNVELVGNLAIYCALVGLAGAKLMMFLLNINYYLSSPGDLFSLDTLLSAGVYHGGFLAAFGFAWLYIRKQGLPWLKTADVLAPGVAAGHAVGRLGCFAAGCCWGDRCDRPWAVTFTNPDAHVITGVPLNIPLHPTQIYEAALTALVAIFLWRHSQTEKPAGRILGLYLVLYSAVRIFTEWFREHDQAPPLAGLTWTQWIAAALIVAGFAILRQSRAATAGSTSASPRGRS